MQDMCGYFAPRFAGVPHRARKEKEKYAYSQISIVPFCVWRPLGAAETALLPHLGRGEVTEGSHWPTASPILLLKRV
jgi:hypothetical protein